MTKNNFGYKSINELQDLYRTKEISPVEVTKEALENIDLLNSKLRAFITITDKYAIKKAKEVGVWRQEGKDYVMQDGDVVEFLFNV